MKVLKFSLFKNLVKHPKIWPTALKVYFSLVGINWYKKPPFLPFIDKKLLLFRLNTMYGEQRDISPSELIEYLYFVKYNQLED